MENHSSMCRCPWKCWSAYSIWSTGNCRLNILHMKTKIIKEKKKKKKKLSNEIQKTVFM